MNMQYILYFGLALLLCSVALQVVVWRFFPVKNQPTRLAAIFVVLPAFLVIFSGAVLSSWPWIPNWSWAAWSLVYLLDLSLALSYMLLYTAVTGFSPSIAILEHVEESMPHGLRREELVPHWFTEENLAGLRHENLVRRRLIAHSRGLLSIQPRGRFIARCFLIFRRFVGLADLARG